MAEQEPKTVTKPFSIGYVLRVTAKHMQRCVETSIRKTFDRSQEFANDPVKANECFRALSLLHAMKRNLEQFQELYQEDFKRD